MRKPVCRSASRPAHQSAVTAPAAAVLVNFAAEERDERSGE